MPYKDPEKRRACHAKWVAENAERNRQHKAKYREANRETLREKSRVYSARYRAENSALVRERNRKWMRKWVKNNRDESNRRGRESYAKHREARSEQNREYRQRRGNALAVERRKKRCRADATFKLSTRVRSAVSAALSRGRKSKGTELYLGCSFTELRVHLERQFAPGMTWDNYGVRGWHIDHIRPLNSFDLSDSAQQAMAFHYTNLQPLWAKDNLAKGAKWKDAA